MATPHAVRTQYKNKPAYLKPIDLTPIKAIRYYCILCTKGDKALIRSCEDETCPLFPFRMGKHPDDYALSSERLQAILSLTPASLL